MEEVYKEIKRLRQSNGYTLKDLSNKTGLSISFLSQVERGSSSLAITSLKKSPNHSVYQSVSFF
nr:helix-turn-helix transcriptional regulator [Bhargavaea beijingensis]